jgi:DNA transposition AAA+ family ATPase
VSSSSLFEPSGVFDAGGIGLILFGMPGIETRLARYPQFYSRVGFVHEFKPLSTKETRRLLARGWRPPEVTLPEINADTVTAIVCTTGGNFRLLNRVLIKMEQIAKIYGLDRLDKTVVEAARQNLVIGELKANAWGLSLIPVLIFPGNDFPGRICLTVIDPG